LLLSIAGYLPFMVDEAHMNVTQRTFMSVAPGAALVFVSVLMMICRGYEKLASIIASALVVLGLVSALYQFDIYNRIYVDVIRPYMAEVVDETDTTRNVHLIFDSSGLGGYVNGMYFTKIRSGPPVRLDQATGMFVLCKDEPLSGDSIFATCTLKDQKWTVTNPEGVTVVPADQVQVIRMQSDFDSAYKAKRKGWRDLGSFESIDSMFYPNERDKTFYSCSADSQWGYLRFCRGEGWTDGHYTFAGHSSFFSAFMADPTLLFDLNPTGAEYRLQLQGTDPIGSVARSNLQILINGKPLHFQVVGLRNIVATVPAGALIKGLNELEFQNVLPKGASTGFGIHRIDLAPVGSRVFDKVSLDDWKTPGMDRWYRFNNQANEQFLHYGFSHSEGDGTWTDGDYAEIGFAAPESSRTGMATLRVIPYLTPEHSHINVDFLVNDTFVSTKAFDYPAELQDVSLPYHAVAGSDSHVLVSMRIRSPAQPNDNDTRFLGIKVIEMQLKK
jgi:hypothetical protein